MAEKIRITYNGRAYPTAEAARERMRRALDFMDIKDVPDEDVVAVEETPGAMCAWGAYAMVTQEDWDRAVEEAERRKAAP